MKFTHIIYIALAAAASAATHAAAQATIADIEAQPGRAGGVYYAYPGPADHLTPAPKGYKPFYISHYGRHGSRYLIGERDYTDLIDIMHRADSANALSPLGRDVAARLDSVFAEARGRAGELTPLGARQHRGIAHRMADAYPEAFTPGARMTAFSTPVMRCAHSMFAFIEGLKDRNPHLEIPRESAHRQIDYLNYHSPESGPYSDHRGAWYQRWRKFKADQTHPDRLIGTLFTDSAYVSTWIDPSDLMWRLYWVAVDMQNAETPISFFDLFTTQELYDLWQANNFNFFACNSSYPDAQGQITGNARHLVADILARAESAIAEGSHGADLRFGHDGNITPLAAWLELDGCASDVADPALLAQDWADFTITPMAANLQIVFFKDSKGDILAKVLLNEREKALPIHTDTFPYYRWDDLRTYLISKSR